MILALVHGFLGSAANWGPIVHKLKRHDQLKKEIFYFTPDLLWHGRNAQPDKQAKDGQSYLSLVVDDLKEQLKIFIDENDLKQQNFIALGHSFGARPLLKIFSELSQKPDSLSIKPQSLIVEDSSPILSLEGFESINKILTKTPVPFTSRPEAKNYFDNNFSPAMSAFLMSNIRKDENEYQDWRFPTQTLLQLLKESQKEDLWREWESINYPIYWVLGAKSDFVKEETQRQGVYLRNNANKETLLEFIPESGHWIHSEQSDLFCEYLVNKLNSQID